MTRILKCVAEADETVRRIKRPPTEEELIQEQRNREPEEEEEPEEHTYFHTLDGGGSFVYTAPDAGLFRGDSTITHFHGNKNREKT